MEQQKEEKKGLLERVREKIIKKLEHDIEPPDSSVDLAKLSDEEREEAFIRFGEGNKGLTGLLRTAYFHEMPSIYCCSGHGIGHSYVMLKVTDENIKQLQELGKVLSNYGIATNFSDHYQFGGKRVTFDCFDPKNNWFDLAADIINHPEKYDSSNPSIYYHEEIHQSYIPLSFKIKKRLLEFLRTSDKKLITTGEENKSIEETKHNWDLTDEEKEKATSIEPMCNDEQRKRRRKIRT